MKLTLAAAVAVTTFIGRAVADIDPIVIKGSKFFYSSNNTQFYIRGVAYQQDYTANSTTTTTSSSSTTSTSYIDPLSSKTTCERDVPILQKLNTNTIRVYAIDPTANHDDCMTLLANAGIYVIADLSDPTESINRDDPRWEIALYNRYTSVIDAMAGYKNTLGFFAGNEVSNTVDTTDASAFVKAAVRDMKSYISSKNYRSGLGVGYATNDDKEIRVAMADYFNCGEEADGIDFWGYNIYSWCGDSSYKDSGYQDRTEEFRNYSVPVFFAEYGCNEVTPRKFTEVEALYGDVMSEVWSGGIVYMYFQEDNDYGLVSVIDSTSVSLLADYTYYSSRINAVSPSGTNKASYTPTNTALQSCPPVTSASWLATASPLPPTPNSALCSCMEQTNACVVDSSVSSSDYADLFSVVCGLTDCTGVSANGTTGSYGAYGMCQPKQQLDWALNKYYSEQGVASACDFSGSATTTSTVEATGSCSSMISQVGTDGTGSVTGTATGSATSTTGTSGAGRVVAGGALGGVLRALL
ncbi:Glucanosyltransferase-domain-containing protein [Aspergillus karnatakaensis]|uniref:glycoside hydrolase family 72 protein n=1 Tax=Aspergillus karnatakaensis TaxID=1810916 RepID=UPI003CCE3B45